jgi:hypothetical protein
MIRGLQFGSLNHAPGGIINPPGFRHDRCQYPDFTSAFGGTADMAGLAADLVPVENDPLRTRGVHRSIRDNGDFAKGKERL